MKRRSLSAFPAGTALALMLLPHLACTTRLPYRTAGLPHCASATTAEPHGSPDVNPPVYTTIKKLADCTERLRVSASSVECHPSFTVATIEFDDQGHLHAPVQADMAIREIRGATDGALIVVFVHGWKHDGMTCDGNMCCFREVLEFLAGAEDRMAQFNSPPRHPRKVIGIYLAWRGASTRTFGLKELTFWNRKQTAHTIGSRRDASDNASNVLSRVRKVYEELNGRDHSKGNRLVLIGHSFGAAILFDAVKDTLENNLRERPANDCTRVSGFGDLVVLVNPAFEAARYRPLFDLARKAGSYCPQQTPLLLTVATKNDFATRYLFPVGQVLKANLGTGKHTTLGNFECYWSHGLTSTKKTAARGSSEAGATSSCDCEANLKELQIAPADQQADQFIDLDLNTYKEFGSTHMEANKGVNPPYFPFLVVAADPNVINGHNGIFSDRFIEFLLRFVGLSDEKKIAIEKAQPSGYQAKGE